MLQRQLLQILKWLQNANHNEVHRWKIWWRPTWTSLRHCLAVLGLSQSIMSPPKPDPCGWGFRTEKGFLAQKYISCQLPPVSLHFLTGGAGNPLKLKQIWISLLYLALLLLEAFLGLRLICFECDLLHQPCHKGWSIYQKEVREIKTDIGQKQIGGRRSDQNSAKKNVKQMWCQDALLRTNSKKSWSSVSLVKSSLTIINVPGEWLREEEGHKRKLPTLQMGEQSH